MKRDSWTQQEFNFLVKARKHKWKNKLIAKYLKRTVMSINKCIQRYRVDEIIMGNLPLPQLADASEKFRITAKTNWVGLEEILKWLHSVGKEIDVVGVNKFLLEGKVFSMQEVFLLANKLRFQKNMDPFWLEGITHN